MLKDESDCQEGGDDQCHSCWHGCVRDPVGCEIEYHEEHCWNIHPVDVVEELTIQYKCSIHDLPR